MTLADLARFVAHEPDFDMQWRLVVEFLKEYHQEPAGVSRSWKMPAEGDWRGSSRRASSV